MNDIRGRQGGMLRGSVAQVRSRIQRHTTLSGKSAANTMHPSDTGDHGNDTHQASGSRRRRKFAPASIAAVALIVGLAGLSGFLFLQNRQASDDGAAVSQRVIDRVSGLYILPEDEEPTVAEIRDRDKLDGQAFFDDAVNGDYLLVYEQAGVALIYRDSANKLVHVSPVGTGPDQSIGNEQQPPGNIMGEQIMGPPMQQDGNKPKPQEE